jgi:pimeloyl-ACP methyl ester carboxylesterase
MPEFLWSDCPWTDIGLYRYDTGLMRLANWPPLSLADEADLLADQIKHIERYDNVVLIGHSMGGLLNSMAASKLIKDRHTQSRLFLINIATPLSGTYLPVGVLSWLSTDAWTLRENNEEIAAELSHLRHHASRTLGSPNSATMSVPMWAIVAKKDLYVKEASASHLVAKDNVFRSREGHIKIVKPSAKDSDWYRFLTQTMASINKHCSDVATDVTATPGREADFSLWVKSLSPVIDLDRSSMRSPPGVARGDAHFAIFANTQRVFSPDKWQVGCIMYIIDSVALAPASVGGVDVSRAPALSTTSSGVQNGSKGWFVVHSPTAEPIIGDAQFSVSIGNAASSTAPRVEIRHLRLAVDEKSVEVKMSDAEIAARDLLLFRIAEEIASKQTIRARK